MSGSHNSRILARRQAADFVGREEPIERLLECAKSGRDGDGLMILARPGAGASELLKQTYDRLFSDQQVVVPIYFSIRPTFVSSREIAEAFLHEFIRQLVAFRRQDPTITRSASGLDELAELSLTVGGFWIDRLITTARSSAGSSDGRAFVRTCLGTPVRAAANNERSFLMIDGVHELAHIDGGQVFLEELKDIFTTAGVCFAFAGHRRFLHGQMQCASLELDNLELKDASRLVEVLAKDADVEITENSRDLIATQLDGNAKLIRQMILAAKDRQVGLGRFDSVEKVYADALFGGRIGREFDTVFATACRSVEVERRVVSMLFDGQVSESGRVERERWSRLLQLGETETTLLLERLNVEELLRLTRVHVEAMTENLPLTDYVAARFRLTAASESRAAIFGDSVAEYIKRAPELMARFYRLNRSVGVREVLGAFAGQNAATVLLDYGTYRDQLKGVPDADIELSVRSGPTISLPRIFFTTAASAFYKPIAQIAESERSAIALGFETVEGGGDDHEIVWIAAEVDSKLEASRELAEFWCDRLEAAALMCDFKRFRIWLIAPEGFSQEALDVLNGRNAFGSSRRQVDLLRKFLDAPAPASLPLAENEYEMVIPMSGDAELVAAHAVEEIARRHRFDSKSINQIKTALVEACINATEHGMSPDGKIYQRFRIEDDRVVLTISNRGLRLTSREPKADPQDGRRGWGLKLMRKLMDEVVVEQVDDGTRIVMTKYMQAAA